MPKKNPNPISEIVHISDLHAGSQYFISNLLSRTVEEINTRKPLMVVVTGDLTDQGFRQEYRTARAFLDQIKCKNLMVVPGNHDARNVGEVHFEELFGCRQSVFKTQGLTVVGVDSSEPDLDSGQVGRERYSFISEHLGKASGFRGLVLHHHLLPVPGTGRERNIIFDAGDLLELILHLEVDFVLSGHKHVPYVWRLENLLIVTAGTASTLRVRGKNKPCYNIIQLGEDKVDIFQKTPFEEEELIGSFLLESRNICPVRNVKESNKAGGKG